jgi:hypothetical protein
MVRQAINLDEVQSQNYFHGNFQFKPAATNFLTRIAVPRKIYAKSDGFLQGNEALPCRAARWYIFKPKFPIWVHFGGSWNGKCWYILRPFYLFYLFYFVVN